MSLIYITGIAGAGKSEVYKELKERGLEVHGTDEDMLAGFYNNESGEHVTNPSDVNETPTQEWRDQHTWKLPRKTIEQLAQASIGKTVYLCGVAANEEEFLDLFDNLYALTIDDETLAQRITTRTNNSFGKNADELRQIHEWQTGTEKYYAEHNFKLVDATQPIEQVVDEILDQK